MKGQWSRGIADRNTSGLRAFRKVGFEPYETVEGPPGAGRSYDVVLTRESYSILKASDGDATLRP